MEKRNLKRVLAIAGIISLFAFVLLLAENAIQQNYSSESDVSLFKKHGIRNNDIEHYVDRSIRYECGHTKVIDNEKKLNQPEQAFDETLYGTDDVSHLLPVEQNYSNIRIKVDFSNIANLSKDTQNYIQFKVFPAVISYIQDAINVQRLTSPIKVDPFYKKKTCGQGKIVIPNDHFQGVDDADLIFYVSSHKQNSPLLAYSSYCPQGKGFGLDSGRPTVAYMSYNLNQLEKDVHSVDTMVLAKWIYMSTHELIHSLVFSPNYFDKFLLEKNPVEMIDGKPYVTAPSVVKVAQEYYGCPTVNKVPLEDEGDKKTTFGFHWERKYFGNEIMTGSFLYDSILSRFTAALFKASGWYQVNDDWVADLTWGIGENCDFLESACPQNTKEFCSSPGKQCNFDYIGQGVCSNSDILSDHCSYFQPSKTQHCTFPDEASQKIYIAAGGNWGPNARCFDTDIAADDQVSSVCFDAHCEFGEDIESTQVVFTVSGQDYKCTNDMKEIEIPDKGKVTCPDVTRFCVSIAACPYSCAGKGICKSGKCHCFDGFTGDDCTQSVA